MASPTQTSVDLPITTFGGRVSQYDPQTLPIGSSPFNQDVVFSGINPSGTGLVAGVATRPGMQPFYAAPFAGNPTVNYLKTFIDSEGIFHLLSLDGLGNFRDENPCPTPPGVPSIIGTVVAGCLAQSDALLNREWEAFSSPLSPGFGLDIPRSWDGQFFNRVSQVGPGAPPTVVDENRSETITSTGLVPIIGTISAISQNGFIVDLVAALSGMFTSALIGDQVVIAGNADGYDATYTIANIISSDEALLLGLAGTLPVSAGGTANGGLVNVAVSAPFDPPLPTGTLVAVSGASDGTYDATSSTRQGGDGASNFVLYIPTNSGVGSGNGSLSLAGNISEGIHEFSVCFITETEYITRPAPFAAWSAAGGKRALFSNIPIGPSNVIGRILICTGVITPPAIGGDFFYLDGATITPSAGTFPSMVIGDNTTTTYTVDFLDAVLEAGTLATNLYNLVELGESSTVCAYSGRLFWCGERNKVPNFNNLTFDGGFSGTTPLGWIRSVINNRVAGGPSPQPYWGGGYRITGFAPIGGHPQNGSISQSAFQDSFGVPIIQPATAYSVRVRLKQGGGLTSGAVTIQLASSQGAVVVNFTVNYAQLTTSYQEFIGALIPAQAQIYPDLTLGVLTTAQILPIGGFIDIDCIEIFPTLQPYNNTQIRGSYALDPESYDSVTGIMQVGVENGEEARAIFKLLDNKLYIVKERSLYSTADDGQNEPSLWVINTVSDTVGTGSPRGVGVGESWAIIAHKTGAYIFWGGEPVKISQEIQPDWDTINWAYDQTIYVVVDTANKRIHIGAPVGDSTVPNVEFVCDYSQLANSEGQVSGQDIASHPQAYYSVYNPTKVVAPGKARKWTLWNISMNCGTLAIRSDGSYHLLRGNATGTGKVYDQVTTQLTDDGAKINDMYQTAYTPQVEDEQALELGSHRKFYKYLTGYAIGSGVLDFTYYGPYDQQGVPVLSLPLQTQLQWDFECNTNWIGERVSVLFSSQGLGSWFELTKLIFNLQRDAVTPVRGNY